MKIEGPVCYELKFTPDTFTVLCPKKTNRFSGIATSSQPKLYIVSVKDRPIYAGISKQSIRNRLRYGWSATGRGGYCGYSWRHQITSANLDVRCHVDAVDRCERDIETVEAEVVFLIRLVVNGQSRKRKSISIPPGGVTATRQQE